MQDAAQDILAKIQKEAEEADAEPRFVRTCHPGDEIRQGDIYLYPLGTPPIVGDADKSPSLQLAEGNSPGSRHIVVGDAVAYTRTFRGSDPLDGPWLHARKRVVLTHPEHADISFPPGWYEVRYQRDFSVRLPRRVID